MARYQVHESVAFSGLELLDNEVMSFLKEIDALERMVQHVGTAEDCSGLRQAMDNKKSIINTLQETISTRLASTSASNADEQARIDKNSMRFNNGNTALRALLDMVAQKEQIPIQGQPPPQPARPSAPPSYQQPAPAYPPYTEPVEQKQVQQQMVGGVPVQVQGEMENPFADLALDGKKLEYRSTVYWDTTELDRRNSEMQNIAQDMVVLQEVFQDAAVELDAQTEDLEVAEEAADDAQVNTKQAVKSLGKSSKNAKKVVLPASGALGGAAVGGITGWMVGGPVGFVMGAGIGAGAGAVVGVGTGSVLKMNANRTMEKARLSERWQPDKAVKNCTACHRPFTKTFRKHHCRNCGFIFCKKCTTHKSYIPGVEDSRKVLVCDSCYNHIMYGREEANLTAVPAVPSKPDAPLAYPDASPPVNRFSAVPPPRPASAAPVNPSYPTPGPPRPVSAKPPPISRNSKPQLGGAPPPRPPPPQ